MSVPKDRDLKSAAATNPLLDERPRCGLEERPSALRSTSFEERPDGLEERSGNEPAA
jgi:hypothetical protein